MQESRKVTRVLVMLEYGPEDPQSGEVFDLTALTSEIANRDGSKHQYADITLEVKSTAEYSGVKVNGKWPLESEVQWKACIDFQNTGRSGWLDDAVNAGLPDSFSTELLRKKLRKVHKAAEKISEDIQVQRLRDAAAVRGKYPIARIHETPQLTAVASETKQPTP